MSNPKLIVRATCASFLIPLAILFYFFLTYDFVNPDGTPDNAPIRSIPALMVLAVSVFIFQLAAYFSLGKAIYRTRCFTYKHGVIFSSWLSLPIPLISVCIWLGVATFDWLVFYDVFIAAICGYLFLWLSFFTGAAVQVRGITKQLRAD
ncbi:hypothetical protein ACMZOO_00840 [Catenovulum sp. SX2]|uniref:hypothetical protein n=1 Tax=Catenovulum sp. SX2 TaxID=3398614 RepID=UPI003F85BABA